MLVMYIKGDSVTLDCVEACTRFCQFDLYSEKKLIWILFEVTDDVVNLNHPALSAKSAPMISSVGSVIQLTQ